MIINRKPYSKYDKPGYYITTEFMHGDADATTYEKFFVPNDDNSKTVLANYLYLLDNIDRENWDSSEYIEKICPDFFWPADCTGWDGLADCRGYEIIYWDGSQQFECDIELEDGDVSKEVIALLHSEDDDWEDEE